MTIKELVECFDGKSKDEIIQALIETKRDLDLESQAEIIAREDGIYYEWLKGNVSTNDYEEFIENTIERLRKEK